MNSFLGEIAKEISFKYSDFKNVYLILPNKRSGLFLKNELVKLNSTTRYAPEIYSIEDFVEELANLKVAQHTQLLFEFYEVYKEKPSFENRDTFQNFSKWAQMILQDFNEIDRHLVHHDKIFSYLSSIKELNHWYLAHEKTELQKNYIKFWNNLKEYYQSFKDRLLKKQIGYQGLIYREAYANTKAYLAKNPEKHHIFIGFNALNKAEEKLIQEFLNYPTNTIFWDIDETFLFDEAHDAGLFIRAYQKEWEYFKKHTPKIISNSFQKEKNIEIIGVPRNIGQAKYVGKLITALGEKLNAENTAIVLGNENLLIPLLNSIPENITSVNITCGMPLYQTPIASFFASWLTLIETKKNTKWHYKNVLNILSHSLTKNLLSYNEKDYTMPIIKNIQQENIIFVPSDYLKKQLPESLSEISVHLFIQEEQLTVNEILQKGIALMYLLKEKHHNDTMYLEYLYKFREIFNQILLFNTHYNTVSDIASLKSIYHDMLHEETVDFKGEPLVGLQIMGMLESRNLDFENVIITSVNEGILPSGKNNTSFIPFEVKCAFQLPTYKERDAIYTYHFYRLLQRAKKVYLLYNTEPDVLEGGERSRFLLQLAMYKCPQHTLKESIASAEISYIPKKPIEIKKNLHLLEALKHIAQRGFSPTSLSAYIRNPIDFYHNTVLNVTIEDEVEETITAKTLGTIIHNTLEALYKPMEGKYLQETDIVKMKMEVNTIVDKNFMQLYKNAPFNSGKNLISLNIVKQYMQQFLNVELNRLKKEKTIKIIHIEKHLTAAINIPELDFTITLKGTLDRVEEVDGIITIIDYKTGKVAQTDIEITNEEDIVMNYKYHKAFQLLSYAYLYEKNYVLPMPMGAAILSFRNFKGGYLKFSKKEKQEGDAVQKKASINQEILIQYERQLKTLVMEIFDITIPFVEKKIKW